MNDRVFHASQAAKLDSPDRLGWLPPQAVVTQLGLSSGMIVADDLSLLVRQLTAG